MMPFNLQHLALCLTLLLALASGCSRRTTNNPVEVSPPAVENSPETTSAETDSPEVQDASSPSAPSTRRLDIELPGTPPTGDPVEPGTYVVSISIELDNGGSVNDRHACTLEVEGEKVTLRMDRSKGEPMVGTLKDGRLVMNAREGEATYGLEGQVVGPGQLRGTVVAGTGLKGVRIVDGRWSLDRVK